MAKTWFCRRCSICDRDNDDLMLLVEMSRDCGWLDTLLAGGTDEDTVSGDDRPDQWTGGCRLKQRGVSHLVVSASKD